MWSAEPPTCTTAEAALACVSTTKDQSLRRRVTAGLNDYGANSHAYRSSAARAELHLTKTTDYSVPEVTDAEQRWLYKQHMASPGGGGREIYSALLAAAPGGLCVYCRHSVAKTLDHFVPKAHAAGLSIEPWNLVPACMPCNHLLREAFDPDPEKEMLHPYFMPDVSRWLYASVVRSNPVTVRFRAEPDPSSPEEVRTRILNQYDSLQLATLFEVVSANELSEVTRRLRTYFDDARPEEVSSHLHEISSSALFSDPNDRRGVMYEALAQDTWFCTTGYVLDPCA